VIGNTINKLSAAGLSTNELEALGFTPAQIRSFASSRLEASAEELALALE